MMFHVKIQARPSFFIALVPSELGSVKLCLNRIFIFADEVRSILLVPSDPALPFFNGLLFLELAGLEEANQVGRIEIEVFVVVGVDMLILN